MPEDHFSGIADAYARGRFGYPPALFDALAAHCPAGDLAWDCATGSGQCVPELARHFKAVVATDISRELLDRAPRIENATYIAAAADNVPLAGATADLITVAQALHWFDLPAFWTEVRRVLKPDGVLAFWGYTWPRVDPAIDAHMLALRATLTADWPVKARLLHDEYRSITAPFDRIAMTAFETRADWQVSDYLAHVGSWSAVRYFRERTGEDPLPAFSEQLAADWPKGVVKPVRWPLHLQAYRVR